MFNFRSSITLLALICLVRHVFVCELHCGNGTVSIFEENHVTGLQIFIIRVENNGKAENKSIRKSHIVNDVFIGGFVHETGQWGESSVHNEFNVTELTGGELQFFAAFRNGCLFLGVSFEDEIDESSSVRSLLGGFQLAVRRINE
jgi:hypothetical protein